jgi:hypothetical protein
VRLEDGAYEGFYAEAPPRIPGDIAFYESMARRADQFSRLPVATVRARSTAMNREVRLRAFLKSAWRRLFTSRQAGHFTLTRSQRTER